MKHALFTPEFFVAEDGSIDMDWSESFQYTHDDVTLVETHDDADVLVLSLDGSRRIPAGELLSELWVPGEPQWKTLKRIAKYMKNHQHEGIK